MSDIFTQIFNAGNRGGLNAVDFLQSQQIREADRAADGAKSQANRATERSLEAEFEVERLRLVMTQAIWEICRERFEMSDAELEAKIWEIDLRDGQKDGKLGAQVAICGSCARKTGVRAHRRCFYCGSALEKKHVVER